MAGKNEAERKARAEELRQEIARWRGKTTGREPAPAETSPASPHEFVERRMRELEQEAEEAKPPSGHSPPKKSSERS